MTHAYDDTHEETAKSYRRIHANGEETHVHIATCGEKRYVVTAVDVDPKEFQPGAAVTIGYEPSIDAAHERAQAWMEQHPRGVGPGSDGGPGIIKRIWNGLQKLDQSQTQEDTNA